MSFVLLFVCFPLNKPTRLVLLEEVMNRRKFRTVKFRVAAMDWKERRQGGKQAGELDLEPEAGSATVGTLFNLNHKFVFF